MEENNTSYEEGDYTPNYGIDIISVFHGEQELHTKYSKAAMEHVEELIRRTQSHIVEFVNANGLECGHYKHREYDSSKITSAIQLETKRRKQKRFPMESTYFYWSGGYEYSVSGECSYELEQDDIIFDLFFAFKLRHIDLMAMSDFLDFHLSEYNGDFIIYLDTLINTYDILISKKIKKVIKKWIKRQNVNQNQTTNMASPEKIKDSISKLELLSKKELTLALHYFLSYNEVEVGKTDLVRFLHLISNTPFTSYQNSTYKDLVKKAPSIGKPENAIITLDKLKELFTNNKLDYIAKLIEDDITKEKESIKSKNL